MAPALITSSPPSSHSELSTSPSSCHSDHGEQTTTTENKTATTSRNDGRLPVTLLSGFLGAGKTTLLEHILTSPNHGLRVGVIVNDVGALNIDAALLRNHDVTRKQEEVVAMQNGCICCTLRGDLLEEVARLAEEGQVDYLLIESSGVSEPQQVAETFSEEFAEMHIAAGHDLDAEAQQQQQEENQDDEKATSNQRLAEILKSGGLSKLARLDTCVTVIDAVNCLNDFNTADFLADRHKRAAAAAAAAEHEASSSSSPDENNKSSPAVQMAGEIPEEDDRNISDLQADQIEFADVIVINKCDLVSAPHLKTIRGLIHQLNPDAKILTTIKSKLDPTEILDTKLFSYEKAVLSAGWLKSLTEGEVLPETEEYGIGTFVYRARRPFHPARLWEGVKDVFVIIQEEFQGDEDENMDENDEGAEESGDEEWEDENEEGEGMDIDNDEEEREEQPQLDPKKRLAAKMKDKTFGPLLRSKGFLWLATRAKLFGEWSQAGVMLTITGGDLWRCELPESELPTHPATREAILKDFQGPWGDRRQELVFIGQNMRDKADGTAGGEKRIRKVLDKCLLTDSEMRKWEKAMRMKNEDKRDQKLVELFEDGWEDWLDLHAGHDHAGGHGH